MKLLLLTLALSAVYAKLPPSCQKPVYCHSKLLHYVQMSQIFPNSRAFVDLQMQYEEPVILTHFEELLNRTNDQPSKEHLQEFINVHFVLPNELEHWVPSDHVKNPGFLSTIKDLKLKQFAQNVHALWPSLGRKVHPSVFKKPELYSIIPVHYGFIVPEESLKEFYYWDTYWIVKGLLVSGMKDTAKEVISNLVELQRQFGYVPYANRYYYQERSQPPLLSAIMSLYVSATHELEFLKVNIDAIESELEYWLDTKSVVFPIGDREYSLLRYFSPSQGPRPEAYYEDFVHAQVFPSEEEQIQFYIDVKSAAESGWEFSSRWFINQDGSNSGNLTNIHTTGIIPVDLNAIFANAMENVAYFYDILQNRRKGVHWAHLAKQWKNSIKEVLWNEVDGIWYDFDLEHSHHRKYFYPSNVAPLWMHAADPVWVKGKAVKIMDYLKKSQSLQYSGGVPASLVRSGEEWDFPNVWPPLVSIMVSALESLQTEESLNMAFQVAQNMVRSTYIGFNTNKQIFDKYDVEAPGKYSGSPHSDQPGYGWSNGVVLEFLAKYGQKMSVQESSYSYEAYKQPSFSLNFQSYNFPAFSPSTVFPPKP